MFNTMGGLLSRRVVVIWIKGNVRSVTEGSAKPSISILPAVVSWVWGYVWQWIVGLATALPCNSAGQTAHHFGQMLWGGCQIGSWINGLKTVALLLTNSRVAARWSCLFRTTAYHFLARNQPSRRLCIALLFLVSMTTNHARRRPEI